MRHTLEGVLEIVGWRRRDETGVNPTEIGVPSIINHVNKHDSESSVAVVRYLVVEGYMFQGVGVRGLRDRGTLVSREPFRRI